MADAFKYWSFISYSSRDARWGAWLHKALEKYRVPKRLVGTPGRDGPIPKRLFPVFRDREELPGSADLAASITEALQVSRSLIVICSPHAAASRWVNEEVLEFKRIGRSDRVMSVIVEGEPNASDRPELGTAECFPPALRHVIGEDGQLSDRRAEPVAADLRVQGDGRQAALLKIIAGVLGVPFDMLRQRDREARRRRLIWRVAAGSAAALLIAFLISMMFFGAQMERDYEAGRRALLDGDAGAAAIWLTKAYTSQGAYPELDFLLGQAMPTVEAERFAFRAGCESVASLAFSPDGSLLALGCHYGEIEVHRADNGALLFKLQGRDASKLRFLADGRRLLSVGRDDAAVLWDLQHRKEIVRFGSDKDGLFDAGGVDDDRLIVTSGISEDVEESVRVWRSDDGQQVANHPGKWWSDTGSHGASLCITATDGNTSVRDARSGKLLLDLASGGICQFSADGARLLFVPQGNEGEASPVRQFETGTWRELADIDLAGRSPQFVRYSNPDASSALVAMDDGSLGLYATASGALVGTVAGPGTSTTAEFSKSGRVLVTTGPDVVQLRRLPDGAPRRRVVRYRLRDTLLNPARPSIATLSDANLVSVLDFDDLERGFSLPANLRDQHVLALDSAGRTALAWVDGALRGYDARSGRELADLVHGSRDAVIGMLSDDGTRAVAGGRKGWVVWRVGEARPIPLVDSKLSANAEAEFLQDGNSVAVLDFGRYRRWSLTDGTLQARFDLDLKHAGSGALSHDGRWFAVADGSTTALVLPGEKSRILVHDAATGAQVADLDAGSMYVGQMELADSGVLAAVSGLSGQVAAWRIEDQKLLRFWQEFSSAPWYLRLSPEGRLLLVGGLDSVEVYSVTDGLLLARYAVPRDPRSAAYGRSVQTGLPVRIPLPEYQPSLHVDRAMHQLRVLAKGVDFAPEWRLQPESRDAEQLKHLVACRVQLQQDGARLVPAKRDEASCKLSAARP